MASMTLARYKGLVASLDRETLQTMKQGRRFRLDVVGAGLAITPSSSGKTRSLPWPQVARVLERFDQTHSYTPGSYRDLTFDASYVLATLKVLLNE